MGGEARETDTKKNELTIHLSSVAGSNVASSVIAYTIFKLQLLLQMFFLIFKRLTLL